jgi:hypothetical protein
MLNPNRSRKIIVNADDFGMSAEVNRAVVEAFHKGAISSATVIINMSWFHGALNWRTAIACWAKLDCS